MSLEHELANVLFVQQQIGNICIASPTRDVVRLEWCVSAYGGLFLAANE